MKYIPTIGLEIHAELKTKSKMFCSCLNDPLEKHPNVNICPICMGHPGTLPTANGEAINKVIKVGLALGCAIPEKSKFDRKSYFYPDLPKGYQISQYDMPFCAKGILKVGERDIHITRVHLEEDTGRLIHPAGADYSLVDFNRAGVPLMELVTEPDITSAKEASAFAQELQVILRYLGASDADMERGQMRVEANISVRPEGQKTLGTKVEVKNLNSFRSVHDAIEFEIKRQIEVLESGTKVVQVTMGWNSTTGTTFVQREKESAHDYRYFPEPDLPPFHFTKEYITSLKAKLPELPQARKQRFLTEYKLSPNEVEILVQEKDLGEYFEKVLSELGENIPKDLLYRKIKLSANYILSDLLGLLQGASVKEEDFLITPENFAELVNLIDENKISSAIAKQVLKEMFAKGGDPSHIIEERGLAQVTNEKEIETIAKEVIAQNPKAVEDFKKGKSNALQFLVGQLMSKTKGTANPQIIQGVLTKLLG
ncbi:MAG: aspartyl-tRNA(Asn)/glutamyl-tRNA (Gln) amidotransferase subunit B [Parcubacteria group bacterium Greene0714_21]|nr:MAG: aspartyl-tRNA(Asn)/glutamyl-tRNA (Gln) amidotransferase subunit B [Parcubacteria group bacterium Greene0416_39]TSC98556.1 MAG: aspartyl-tRNA(Asn)/glutamyl-tRNA (Gln) amidotransferase subunit B [Parcubacteria group bacterium Greene1014_47]TSD04317.1 MAG: aspartyl-tRNA(Asn)/glutamyl-tRNA (Gln) amidotransferase subunit B [Parcubacteria group bacterium Greene0714_21]